MNVIQKYLIGKKYSTVSDDTYSHIEEWMNWYQGKVRQFHQYTVFNGIEKVSRKRYSLGMAKKVCEDWANLILNEKVKIQAGQFDQRLQEILQTNNFSVRANQLIELVFAIGTGAFVEYKSASEEIVIDYVRADMVYPLSWDNGDITECAFGSCRVVGGREQVYLQIHRLEMNQYVIENHYIDAESGCELEVPEGVQEIIETGSEQPLFQIVMPNLVNNIDLDSPMGIGCYANAIDQLKAVDLAYDSYCNEFELGKKRILLPTSFAKIKMQEDGVAVPVFDKDDTVFYAYQSDKDGEKVIKEINMEIRAQEHEAGLQRFLDLLSAKCGLGNDRYRFQAGTAKTATEVISEKSELYQNLTKNEIPVRTALQNMVQAVAFLDGVEVAAEDVVIDFDDSIITDTQTEQIIRMQEVSAGITTKESYLMWRYNVTKEEAVSMMPVQKEQSLFSQEE